MQYMRYGKSTRTNFSDNVVIRPNFNKIHPTKIQFAQGERMLGVNIAFSFVPNLYAIAEL